MTFYLFIFFIFKFALHYSSNCWLCRCFLQAIHSKQSATLNCLHLLPAPLQNSEIIAYCIESILLLPPGLIPVKIGIFILPTTLKKKLCCAVFQAIILNTSCSSTSTAGPVAWRTSISLSLSHWLGLWSSLWYQHWYCSCSCSVFVAGFQCGFDAALAYVFDCRVTFKRQSTAPSDLCPQS